MSLRSWILAAVCAALTIGTFTPEPAQAGWRRRCGGRVYGCRWRGGYGYARRGGWGGWYGGFGGGYGYGGYGVCSTGFGFGGNYLAGGGAYGTPYVGNYSMPYYASNNVNPYLGGAYNTIRVASASSLYTTRMTAGKRITAPAYPGDPVAISSPTTSFLARYTAVSRNTNGDRPKAATSFIARHSSSRGTATESSEGLKSNVKPGNGYGYGLASGSGYSYKSMVGNATKDLSNFGLTSVAMNP